MDVESGRRKVIFYFEQLESIEIFEMFASFYYLSLHIAIGYESSK
jgi:hypothetical protein